MNAVMIVGMVATFVGALWARYEHDNPDYWAFSGISRNASDVVRIVTTLLFPGGYVLILLAPGHSWLFNIGMVLIMHFVGVQVVAGLVSGAIAGFFARRRLQRKLGELTRDDEADN